MIFLKSLPFRSNPALRFCQELVMEKPLQILVSPKSILRCKISCNKGSLVISDNVAIAKNTEVNVGEAGLIELDKGVRIGSGSLLSVGHSNVIKVGEGTTFFSTVFLSGTISIGRGCLFSKNITILSGTHIAKDRRPIREQDAEYLAEHGAPPNEPIYIGDDCWVGINVVILPGVNIGRGCVIGAGAVVTKDFPEYSKIGGVPAKVLGYREKA